MQCSEAAVLVWLHLSKHRLCCWADPLPLSFRSTFLDNLKQSNFLLCKQEIFKALHKHSYLLFSIQGCTCWLWHVSSITGTGKSCLKWSINKSFCRMRTWFMPKTFNIWPKTSNISLLASFEKIQGNLHVSPQTQTPAKLKKKNY